MDWDFGPGGLAWLKVTRPLEVPGRREEGNCGSKEVSGPGSREACLLPEAIGWCSPDRGEKFMRGAGGGGVRESRTASGPPGRRAERGWHGVADGGTAFVCCWRSLCRAVPCMRMRPLGATGPSPDRGLRVYWGRVGRTRDGTSSGVQEPGLGAEHGGGILARAQLYWQDRTSKLGRELDK